jgi:AcrR family transcriptional regulator
MPKVVDPEERRAALAEALWRVLAREGMKGVTVRAVCAEAGWSRDAVDHYFAGKEALVRYACALAVERILGQVRERCRRLRGRAALRAVLLEGLALEGGPEAADAWLELLTAAGRDPQLAAEFARFDREVTAELGAVVAEMVAGGEAAAGSDPEAEARALFAFNLGLRSRQRLEPARYTDDVVAAEVDAYLDRLAKGTASAE